MSERVYKKIRLVGVSRDSYEKAIKNAIEEAGKTLHGLAWFEFWSNAARIVEEPGWNSRSLLKSVSRSSGRTFRGFQVLQAHGSEPCGSNRAGSDQRRRRKRPVIPCPCEPAGLFSGRGVTDRLRLRR
jgi:flavin-binding protein dodecin